MAELRLYSEVVRRAAAVRMMEQHKVHGFWLMTFSTIVLLPFDHLMSRSGGFWPWKKQCCSVPGSRCGLSGSKRSRLHG